MTSGGHIAQGAREPELRVRLPTTPRSAHPQTPPSYYYPLPRRPNMLEQGGAAKALTAIRATTSDLALAYAWTHVCFKAWDDALER